jgi:hypothetical protein
MGALVLTNHDAVGQAFVGIERECNVERNAVHRQKQAVDEVRGLTQKLGE